MKSIQEYELNLYSHDNNGVAFPTVTMPAGAQPLSVRADQNRVILYVIADSRSTGVYQALSNVEVRTRAPTYGKPAVWKVIETGATTVHEPAKGGRSTP